MNCTTAGAHWRGGGRGVSCRGDVMSHIRKGVVFSSVAIIVLSACGAGDKPALERLAEARAELTDGGSGPPPGLRLSADSVTVGGASAAAVSDRDTTTGLDVAARMQVTFQFNHDVTVARMKIAGSAVAATLGGTTVLADHSWGKGTLAAPVVGRQIVVTITPQG